ncbi:MAG: hypothetical protein R3Y56_02290 [Akkermansia sp.]
MTPTETARYPETVAAGWSHSIASAELCLVICLHRLPDGSVQEHVVGGITGTKPPCMIEYRFVPTSNECVVEIVKDGYYSINRIKTL